MMRKLLILTLVLGMASMASATISFVSNSATVTTGGSVTVSVQSDADDTAWSGYLGYTPGLASLVSVAAQSAAGTSASATATAYSGYYFLLAADFSDPQTTVDTGVQFTGNLVAGLSTGVYAINLWGSSWTAGPLADTFTLTIVPEPITLALLGLGGLFLRRRK
jgi:hypothetical protein